MLLQLRFVSLLLDWQGGTLRRDIFQAYTKAATDGTFRRCAFFFEQHEATQWSSIRIVVARSLKHSAADVKNVVKSAGQLW